MSFTREANSRNPMFARVGLLALHYGALDRAMPAHHRLEKEKFANGITQVLSSGGFDVVYLGLVTDESSGSAVSESFKSVDIVVVMFTMVTPPTFGWAALSRLPEVSVVIWNLGTLREIREGFDAADLVSNSSNVGTVMLANILRRESRRFRVCTVNEEDPESVGRAIQVVKSAAAASKLRKARLGMIGPPVAGYLNVAVDRESLRNTLGIELVEISQAEHESSYAAVTSEETEHILSEVAEWSSVELSRVELGQAAKLTAALSNLVQANRLDGGTVNCRSTFFLDNPKIGIVACLAVSYLLRQGVPFTCTGDMPAAIAELMLKFLGLPAQWCECNVVDSTDNFVLLSTIGEGDPALAPDPKAIRIIQNRRFKPDGCGPCLQYPFAPGDATLIGLAPQPSAQGGWTLAVAPGKLVDRYFPRIGVPNGAFAFQRDAADSLENWFEAGPTHHAVVTRGKQTALLSNLAYFLNIEIRHV